MLQIIISGGFGALAGFIASLFMQNRVRRLDARTYAAAVAREMLLITRKLNSYSTALRGLERELLDDRDLHVPELLLSDQDLIVYHSNTAKIGLLEGPHALRLLKFYQQVRDLRVEVREKWGSDWIDKGEGHLATYWVSSLNEHEAEVKKCSAYGSKLLSQLHNYSLGGFFAVVLLRARFRIRKLISRRRSRKTS